MFFGCVDELRILAGKGVETRGGFFGVKLRRKLGAASGKGISRVLVKCTSWMCVLYLRCCVKGVVPQVVPS